MIEIQGTVIPVESIEGEFQEESLGGDIQGIYEIEGHNPMPLLYGGYVVKSAMIVDAHLILTLADGTDIDLGVVSGGEQGPQGPAGADAPIDYAYSDADLETLDF